jgi:hypothetical protein
MPDCDKAVGKVVHVHIHNLRKKLVAHGIRFNCVAGEGYTMKPEHKLRVRGLLADHEGAATITQSYPARLAAEYGITDFPPIMLARPKVAA